MGSTQRADDEESECKKSVGSHPTKPSLILTHSVNIISIFEKLLEIKAVPRMFYYPFRHLSVSYLSGAFFPASIPSQLKIKEENDLAVKRR